MTKACDLGRIELGESRYCYTHGGFTYWYGPPNCDKRPVQDGNSDKAKGKGQA